MLTVVDVYSRERLAIRVARRITSYDVLFTGLAKAAKPFWDSTNSL